MRLLSPDSKIKVTTFVLLSNKREDELEQWAQQLLDYEARAQARVLANEGQAIEKLVPPKVTRNGGTLYVERGFRSTAGAEYWAFSVFRAGRAVLLGAEGRPGVSRAELQNTIQMFRERMRE
jgi:hypothetical protein